jgi:hypothetical protein
MFESLSDLDNKQEISICRLNEGSRSPIDVRYVFYPGNQRSHRISFKKRNRTLFELFVGNEGDWMNEFSQIGHDILNLYQIPMSEKNLRAKPGFCLSVLLFILGKRVVHFSECFSERFSEHDFGMTAAASLRRKYFLALCSGWTGQIVLLLQDQVSKGASTYRKSQSFSYNWVKISKGDFQKLIKSVDDFSADQKFGG